MRKTAVGAVFGSWTVVQAVDGSHVKCRCVCGADRVIYRSNLTAGKTRSCGCNKARAVATARTTHGQAGSSTYSTWSSMLTRCHNQKSRSFPRYGGRGIRVCERWMTFENFLADMGQKPPGMSIDRIDNSKGYEPSNCRWATAEQQSRNTRRTRLSAELVEALRKGALTAREVCAATGAAPSTASAAINGRNWKTL